MEMVASEMIALIRSYLAHLPWENTVVEFKDGYLYHGPRQSNLEKCYVYFPAYGISIFPAYTESKDTFKRAIQGWGVSQEMTNGIDALPVTMFLTPIPGEAVKCAIRFMLDIELKLAVEKIVTAEQASEMAETF